MEEIEYGYCQCGCGQKTNIAKATRSARGLSKGDPHKYCQGHHAKVNPPN